MKHNMTTLGFEFNYVTTNLEISWEMSASDWGREICELMESLLQSGCDYKIIGREWSVQHIKHIFSKEAKIGAFTTPICID